MLIQAIQAEVDSFVEGHADLVDDQGRKRILRNGHAPERSIQTGIGPIEVQRPLGAKTRRARATDDQLC